MPNASDPAAVAEFERLLMATSRVTIRYLGGSQKPAVATLALDLDGTRALSLVVYIDPKKKKTTGSLRNTEPYLAFRTELTLQDGRGVTKLSHPGVAGLS